MFQEPKKYTDNDHFFFESDKDLEKSAFDTLTVKKIRMN